MISDQLQVALMPLGRGMAIVQRVIASTLYACPTRDWLLEQGVYVPVFF